MVASQPHFLLFSRADVSDGTEGRWHFLLESIDGSTVMQASDREQGLRKERLELLAVVRGLEALAQPSRVTLITPSQRIARGFRQGLEQWRDSRWRWERDGRWVPIKNRDLWQRVDRALQFHRVQCRRWQYDARPVQDHSLKAGLTPPQNRQEAAPNSVWSWPDWGKRLGAAARPLFGWSSPIEHWGAAS